MNIKLSEANKNVTIEMMLPFSYEAKS